MPVKKPNETPWTRSALRCCICRSYTTRCICGKNTACCSIILLAKHMYMFLRAISIIVTLCLTSCAHRYTGTPTNRLQPSSRVFSSLTLSEKEKRDIVRQMSTAQPTPERIYAVAKDREGAIEVQSLDSRPGRYGNGRVYYFKQSEAGLLLDQASEGYWSSL